MPKPLHSEDPNPKYVQFSHFGVLDDGKSSKGAAITSILLNVAVAALIVIVGYVVKTNPAVAKKITELTLPPEPVKPPPPPPKPPPPPPPKMPPPPKLEPPKIKMPDPVPEKVPDIKPIVVPTPKPVVIAPAPPKAVTPPPAPKVVNLATAMAASVPNHDANPSPVRLGSPDNPLKSTTGPAVSRVNLGSAGMPGMPASNSGSGPHATSVNMGSGSPGSQNMNGHDNAAHTVVGVKLGVPGGTGPLTSKNFTNQPVNLQAQVAPAPVHPMVLTKPASKNPVVTYKPEPAYTNEAKSLHLEGNVSVRIRVSSAGAVQVLGVVHGLGHGLDESAVQAAGSTRFKPAVDADGHSIDWEGVVLVTFQMS